MRNYVIKTRQPPRGALSKSKIYRFRRCPEAFRRIQNGEPDFVWHEDEDEEDLSEVGILFHRTLEIEHDTRKAENRLDETLDADELVDTLKLAAVPASERTTPDIRSIEKCASIIHECAHNVSFKHSLGAEIPFRLALTPKKDFVGIYDFVRKVPIHDGFMIELVDWKSGDNVLDEDQARHDVQVCSYLAAAKRQWPEAKAIRFTLEYVAVGGRTFVDWSQKLDDTVLAYLRDVLSRIENNYEAEKELQDRAKRLGYALSDDSIWPARVGAHCKDCGFRSTCKPYESWVKTYGYEPLPPLSLLETEALAAEAIRSKTLVTIHDKRRKDAYEILRERMGAQRRVTLHGYDFSVVRRRDRLPIEPDDALQILVDNGVPLTQAASAIRVREERYFDEECLDDFAKFQGRGWKGRIKKLIQDTRQIKGTNEHLEAREVEGGLY